MLLVLSFSGAMLVTTLGISSRAAYKAIDIVSSAGTIWSIIGLIGVAVGSGEIGILFTAKALVKKFGKRYAVAW